MPSPEQIAESLVRHLPADREDKNRKALAVLLPAMVGGEIYNTEFQDAKKVLDRSFENAYNDIVRTDYTTYWEGPNKDVVSARGQVSNELGIASGLRSSISVAKKVAKLKVTAPNLVPLRALLAAAVPFAELMEKLKTKVIKGRRPAAGGTSKERQVAARRGGSGECQVCAGNQALLKGMVALHGYKRPGVGFIEGRCMGSQELPYEVSCEVLRKYIGQLKRMLSTAFDRLTAIPFATVFHVEKQAFRNGRYVPEVRAFTKGDPGFENARDNEKRDTEFRIREITREIEAQEKRLNAWVPQL